MNRSLFATLLCTLVCTTHLLAQANVGMLRGTVSDPQHLAIPQAEVTLTVTATGVERKVRTDARGRV